MTNILLCQTCGITPAQAACKCKANVKYFCIPDLKQHLTDVYISHMPVSLHKSINLHLNFLYIYQNRQLRYRNAAIHHSSPASGSESLSSLTSFLAKDSSKTLNTSNRLYNVSEHSSISSSISMSEVCSHEVHSFKGHLEKVNCVAVSHDNRYILSGSDDCGIFIWKIHTKRFYRLIEGWNPVVKFALCRNDRELATISEDNVIRVFNIQSRRIIGVLEGHSNVINCISYSRDGNRLISGSHDFSIKVWNLDTWRIDFEIFVGYFKTIECLAVSYDFKYIVSGFRSGKIQLWDSHTKQMCMCFQGHSNWITCLLITEHNEYVISGSLDFTIRVWSVTNYELVSILTGHKNSVNSLALTHDEKYLISGSGDFTVRIWDLVHKKQVSVLEGHSSCVNAVAVTQDDRYIVSGSGGVMTDYTVRMWALDNNKKRCEIF